MMHTVRRSPKHHDGARPAAPVPTVSEAAPPISHAADAAAAASDDFRLYPILSHSLALAPARAPAVAPCLSLAPSPPPAAGHPLAAEAGAQKLIQLTPRPHQHHRAPSDMQCCVDKWFMRSGSMSSVAQSRFGAGRRRPGVGSVHVVMGDGCVNRWTDGRMDGRNGARSGQGGGVGWGYRSSTAATPHTTYCAPRSTLVSPARRRGRWRLWGRCGRLKWQSASKHTHTLCVAYSECRLVLLTVESQQRWLCRPFSRSRPRTIGITAPTQP